jgi:hypothetical protein
MRLAANHQAVIELLERALADSMLLQRLMVDPLGTARAERVQVTTSDVKRWLGVPEATDEELFEMIRGWLARAHEVRQPPSVP